MVRMQAGLQLKNALYSKDPTIREQYQQRWHQFPVEVKEHIKKCVSTVKLVVLFPQSVGQESATPNTI